ncbi:MAG: hypothetical protein V4635_09570 [Bacteroidota bacterium]
MSDHLVNNVLLEIGEPTLSNIIRYVYGAGDLSLMDAFNTANKEILVNLKSKEKEEIKDQELAQPEIPMWNGKPLYKKHSVPKPLKRTGSLSTNYRKVFDYVVNRKLDYSEILDLDPQFKTTQDIKAIFANLKGSQYAQYIDSVYKKHHLNLPPFSTWKASDLNKGPSDRGELKPEPSEFGKDQFGNLSRVKYDKFGQSSTERISHYRDFMTDVLKEMTILTKNIIV